MGDYVKRRKESGYHYCLHWQNIHWQVLNMWRSCCALLPNLALWPENLCKTEDSHSNPGMMAIWYRQRFSHAHNRATLVSLFLTARVRVLPLVRYFVAVRDPRAYLLAPGKKKNATDRLYWILNVDKLSSRT